MFLWQKVSLQTKTTELKTNILGRKDKCTIFNVLPSQVVRGGDGYRGSSSDWVGSGDGG